MTDERRYSDGEVREIFELATSARDGTPSPAADREHGPTLADLREIAAEVGVPAKRVERAAAALDGLREETPTRTRLGLPVSVGRTVELERGLGDEDWEALVAECRSTFDARGSVSADGRLREWRTGNLHVTVEPTERGHRLRMGSRLGAARVSNLVGVGGIAFAFVTLVSLVVTGAPAGEYSTPVILGGIGVGALVANAVRVPRWARERREQMAYLADRVEALIEEG